MEKTVIDVMWDVLGIIGLATAIMVIYVACNEICGWIKHNFFTLTRKDARRRKIMRMIRKKMRTGEIIGFNKFQEIKWAYEADPVLRERLIGVENLIASLHYEPPKEDGDGKAQADER